MGDIEILLHQECTKMLRRPSKIKLVDEVMYDLFEIKKTENNMVEKDIKLLEIILYIFGCNKSI